MKPERRDITTPRRMVSFLTSLWVSLTRLIYKECCSAWEKWIGWSTFSKWDITLLTNVAFHVYPLVDRPTGLGEKGKLRIEVWMQWEKTRTLASSLPTT